MVGIAAGAMTVFVFFVAHYAELRAQLLIRVERQLSLEPHGRMAATTLGRKAFFEALSKSATAAGFSLAGALLPLAICASMPTHTWLGLAITLAALGVLGVMLARSFYGVVWIWSSGLVAGGIGLALLGMKLDIAG